MPIIYLKAKLFRNWSTLYSSFVVASVLYSDQTKTLSFLIIKKLLETCSNNCNKRFQLLLANKDFLQELKSMIGPKLQPPLVVQEKVLYLIQVKFRLYEINVKTSGIEV